MNRRAIAFALLLASSPAFADIATGVVAGTIALEPMKPIPPDPSYVIKTKRPIEDPEAPRAIVYLVRDDGAYPAHDKKSAAALAMVQHGYQFRPAIASRFRTRTTSFTTSSRTRRRNASISAVIARTSRAR